MKDKKEKKKGIFAFSKKKEEKQKFSEPILISEHTHLDQMQKQANAAQQYLFLKKNLKIFDLFSSIKDKQLNMFIKILKSRKMKKLMKMIILLLTLYMIMILQKKMKLD